MLEMKSETGSSGPDISFEMPAHEMCTERRAVLYRADGQSEWMTFAIDFMPDKIHVNGRKFVYEGVSDGRGFYREWEEAPGVVWKPLVEGDPTPEKEIPPSASSHEAVETDCSPENGCGLQSVEACIPGSIDLADCELLVHYHHPENGLIPIQWIRGSDLHTTALAKNGCGNQQTSASKCLCPFPPISGGHFANCPEFEPKQSACVDRVCYCDRRAILLCYHGVLHQYPCEDCDRLGLSLSVEVHTIPENVNPAPDIPCSGCSETLDLVSEMIENPPGLSGIHCHLGHIGNQYVDAGWVEALTRVKWHLVTGASGTREAV